MNLNEKFNLLKAVTMNNLPVASKRYYELKKKIAEANTRINQLSQINTILEITKMNLEEANSHLTALNKRLEEDLIEVTATKEKYLKLYKGQCGLNTAIKEEKGQIEVKYNRSVSLDKIFFALILLSWALPWFKDYITN